MDHVTFNDLQKRDDWKKAVIVFKEESFDKPYSEEARSYRFSRDNKYFKPGLIGNSLYGYCLDGLDDGVRLDYYMHRLPQEGTRWLEDYCYIEEMEEPIDE